MPLSAGWCGKKRKEGFLEDREQDVQSDVFSAYSMMEERFHVVQGNGSYDGSLPTREVDQQMFVPGTQNRDYFLRYVVCPYFLM